MKHPRLVILAAVVTTCCVSLAFAGAATKLGKAAAGDCCGAKATTATAAAANGACPASMSCPAGSAQCTMKSAKGVRATAASASGSCSMHGAATTAASGSCAMHGATTAAAAGNCASHTKGAMAAGTCSMQNASGGKCEMAGMPAGGCAVCSDAMSCDEDVHGLNAHAQVVALRNGVMIVYTAETPENVRALQASLARHNETTMNAFASNSAASLCGGCKSFRGAMASGKFSRELVNVKSGAQVLLTSSDREVVRRIHDMSGVQAARTKS